MKSEDEQGDEELQAQIAEQVRRWRGRTIYLGLGLIVSVLLWTPFFDGRPLHHYWTSFGRIFAVLSLIFFFPCLYSVATMMNLWYYGASLRRIDRQFATGLRKPKMRRR